MKKLILSGLLALGLYNQAVAKPVLPNPNHGLYNMIVPTLVSMYTTWGMPANTFEDVIASSLWSTGASQACTSLGEWYFTPQKASIFSQTGRCAAKCTENMIIKSCGFGARCLAQGLKTNPLEKSFVADTAIPFVTEVVAGMLVSGLVESSVHAWFTPVNTKPSVDVSYLKSRGHKLAKQAQARKVRNQNIQQLQAQQVTQPNTKVVHQPAERLLQRA